MYPFTAVAEAMGLPGGGSGGSGAGGYAGLIPLVLMFVIFYFLLIRPQQKKAKQHRELLSNLEARGLGNHQWRDLRTDC